MRRLIFVLTTLAAWPAYAQSLWGWGRDSNGTTTYIYRAPQSNSNPSFIPLDESALTRIQYDRCLKAAARIVPNASMASYQRECIRALTEKGWDINNLR